MTQEEKFKEAQRLYETANADQKYVLERLFPELRESEDERIKSAAIEFVIQNKSFNYYLGISKDDVVTWINRQGEQKLAWSEEDDIMKQHCHQMLALLRPNSSELIKDTIDNCHHWLKDLKDRVQPQNRWKPSKRQKEALLWCVVHLGGADKQTLGELLEELNKL